MCGIAYTFELDAANGKAAQSGNVFRAMASAYAVFVIVPIDNVMAAVFNAPVTTVSGKSLLRIGLLGGSAVDAISDFTGVFTVFLSVDSRWTTKACPT